MNQLNLPGHFSHSLNPLNQPFLVRMTKLSINQAQDAMGFRQALAAALANFILVAHSGDLLSVEDLASGKRSLSPVDRALAKMRTGS